MIDNLKSFLRVKKYRNLAVIASFLFLMSIALFYTVSNNEWRYKNPIAKVISVNNSNGEIKEDLSGNSEQTIKQTIEAKIMNGKHKGQMVQLENSTSFTGAYDINLSAGDEVFLKFEEDADGKIINPEAKNLKRDTYLAYIVLIFSFLILVIGGIKGFRSLISVIMNVVIFSFAIGIYLGGGYNIYVLFIMASIVFVVVSIFLVCGVNKKSISAILGTFASTICTMTLLLIVLYITGGNGLHFENMEFNLGNYQEIFLVEILIGTLGGIMDLAVSISSAIQELKEHNPDISPTEMMRSGMEIGKDTMGTMANALLFAYISGSIPMIIMWMVNDISIGSIISFYLSLEVIRALVGSIGVVLSIPVTLVIATRVFHRKPKIEVIDL